MSGQSFRARDWRKMSLTLACLREEEQGTFWRWSFYGLHLIRMHRILSVRDRMGESRGTVGEEDIDEAQGRESQVTCGKDQARRQHRMLSCARVMLVCQDMVPRLWPLPTVG